MFEINTDKTISITRGDSGSFVAPIDYALQPGDVLRLKVFRKKTCEDVVLQKDFTIEEATETVTLELTEKDTRIGEIISKPVDYWYEIELNPDNNPKTLVGYDEDGAKIFKLYPEGRDLEDDELTEEEKDTLRKYLDEFKDEINNYLEKEIEDMQSYLEKEVAELQGELDEIGDLVGGETEEATELVADLGDIEFAYSSGDGGYVGNFTLPDVPLEKNKRYAISVDGKEYKSTVAEVEGRLYLCNDAREDLGILAMCQDNNWSIVIFTSSDFSGTHNIKIYAGPNDKKAYQVVAYMATSNTGAYSFHTDEFDAGNYGLVIRDDNGTEYYNNPLRRLSADAVFGFKSCDKDYSDVSLTQVYNAIAEGKTLSFIVTGDIDGVETTKTYTLGAPEFEWINPNNQRHYYGYGENYFAYVDYMLG